MIDRTELDRTLDAIEDDVSVEALVFLVPISKEALEKCLYTAEEIEEIVEDAIAREIKDCLNTQPPVRP